MTAPLLLLLELAPLAFGPTLPAAAFLPPRELTCPLHDLGRAPAWVAPLASRTAGPTLDPRTLTPTREQYLVNPLVDGLMLLATAYGTRATWDDRTWSTRAWQATGAVAPMLIPPQAPPVWNIGH